MIDYYIKMLNLPGKVHEAVTLNDDGSYTIFINDYLSPTAKREAVIHALKHIDCDDFYIEEDVNFIERRAHNE